MKKLLKALFISVLFVAIGHKSVFAASSTIYNSLPEPTPGNVPSVGYEATSTSEFGGQVQFSGTERFDPMITILMSSWACESGTWNGKNCVTSEGATFSQEVTINVYNVGVNDAVGSLVVSKTETFQIPYRPSADSTYCTGVNEGKWWDGVMCVNGKAYPIEFNLTGVVLPDKVIIGVAYNTSHYGDDPKGTGEACFGTPEGCAYDSLNVGTYVSASVGTPLPTTNDAYLSSTWGGAYCDAGLNGTGTFRLDAGCWGGFLPAIKVDANPPAIIASVNGGGHILDNTDAKRKEWYDVSFGGWINKLEDDSLGGEYEVILHNVSNDTLDKSRFHGSDVVAFNLFDGDHKTCNDAVNFTVSGTWNDVPGYSMVFRAGDLGSPNTSDTVRITIHNSLNGTGTPVYDTSTADFDKESDCVGNLRTGLDTGNITIWRD